MGRVDVAPARQVAQLNEQSRATHLEGVLEVGQAEEHAAEGPHIRALIQGQAAVQIHLQVRYKREGNLYRVLEMKGLPHCLSASLPLCLSV